MSDGERASTARRLVAAYDEIAPDFAVRHETMRPEWARFGQRVLDLAGGGPARVLDVGCGPGRDVRWFAEQGTEVVGIDPSLGMLREARRRGCRRLVHGDARALPFQAGSFDAAWCMASLLHLPKANLPVALAETRRVLRPGGVLVVTLKAGKGEAWEVVPYRPEVERFFARYGLAEAASLVAGANFAVVEQVIEDGAPVPDRPEPERWLRLLAVGRP